MAKKGEMSRQQILDAAKVIIRDKGMVALSHSAVAEMVGISKSAVHWHFPTKYDLLAALIDDYVFHLKAEEERHERRFIDAGLTPGEAVLPGMWVWFLDFRCNREGWIGIGSALISLSLTYPEIVEPIRDWYRGLYDKIDRAGIDKTRGTVAMMVFDEFFNSSKLGIQTLSLERLAAVNDYILTEAFAGKPEKLKIIRAVTGD